MSASEAGGLTLCEALAAARETKALVLSRDCLRGVPETFSACFGSAKPLVVADENTFRVAGERVQQHLSAAGCNPQEPFIFEAAGLHAEERYVARLEAALSQTDAVPVAVGSGTLNDLCKLASHKTGRRYMAVATAASMDGYTAFGASITVNGSKQTCFCPAPVAVVGDLSIIAKAPKPMNSWGYADLIAKVTAGADWILADALQVEPIDHLAWNIAQGRLAELVSNPIGVSQGDPMAIESLTEGLMLSGFAMQATASSRPASGAEHQFSHLWDMQHHTHHGVTPSHGFKVGIGTLAVAALYEELLASPLVDLDVDACCRAWASGEEWANRAKLWLGERELSGVAKKELVAKHVTSDELRVQLENLKRLWPDLRHQLREQLLPTAELRRRLLAAGAPVDPEEIGISRARLRESYWQAFSIRRRFTVLDIAVRTGLLESCLDRIFGDEGVWPIKTSTRGSSLKLKP